MLCCAVRYHESSHLAKSNWVYEPKRSRSECAEKETVPDPLAFVLRMWAIGRQSGQGLSVPAATADLRALLDSVLNKGTLDIKGADELLPRIDIDAEDGLVFLRTFLALLCASGFIYGYYNPCHQSEHVQNMIRVTYSELVDHQSPCLYQYYLP